MRTCCVVIILLLSLPAMAQQVKVVDIPEFTYHDNNPDRYKWKKVCIIRDRIIFCNAIACTDDMIYSFGGFNTEVAQHEMNAIVKGKFRKTDLQYPGRGFMDNLFFIRDSLLYVGGGVDSNQTNYNWEDFWQYNLNTKAWKRLKDLPFYYRNWQNVFTGDDKVIALIPQLGGEGFKQIKVVFYAYDPATDHWTQLERADAAPDIASPVSFKIGDDVFVFSQSAKGKDGPVNAFYKFNITTREWASLPPFPGAGRTLAFGCSDGRYGYVGGGIVGKNAGNGRDVYRYDPIGTKWERFTDLPRGVRWAKGWSFKDDVYVGFGINDNYGSVEVWKMKRRK